MQDNDTTQLTKVQTEQINAVGDKIRRGLEAIQEHGGTPLAFWQEFVRNLSTLLALVKPFAETGDMRA